MQIITQKEAKAQGLKRYFTGEPCKYGHIAERSCRDGYCLACKAASAKAWYEANREKELARHKACYEANRKEVLARQKVYYEANSKKVVARKKVCYEANHKKMLARQMAYRRANPEKVRAQRKAYLASNPQARAAGALRTRIRRAIKDANASKSASSLELLGASIEEVRAHLEAQFKLGMTWDNWSFEGWHIDHIKPCASFDLTDPEQQKACFHYSNLQPLWAKDNLSKNDRRHKKGARFPGAPLNPTLPESNLTIR